MSPEDRAKETLRMEKDLQLHIDHVARDLEGDYRIGLKYVNCKYGPIYMFIPDVCIFAYNEAVSEFGSFDLDEDSFEKVALSLGLSSLDWDLLYLAYLFVKLSVLQTYKNPEWDFLEIDPSWLIVEV